MEYKLESTEVMTYLATNQLDLKEYWELAVNCMTSKRYGLLSVDFLKEFERSVNGHTVILSRCKISGKLLGAMRAINHYDLSNYSNLKGYFKSYWTKHGICQTSSYVQPSLSKKDRILVFEHLFAVYTKVLTDLRFEGLYAEVPPAQIVRYGELGFYQVGEIFKVEGWANTWAPIVCNFRSVISNVNNDAKGFQSYWKERIGTPLDLKFWNFVNSTHSLLDVTNKTQKSIKKA